MKHTDLRNLVRTLLLGPKQDYNGGVSGGHVTEALRAAETIREALAERGLGPNCHLGDAGDEGSDRCVEWYAGQFLDIVDNKAWLAMNSLLNCCEKFCPPGALPPPFDKQ